MTTLTAPSDTLTESARVISLLTQHTYHWPLASQLLVAHQQVHRDLERSRQANQQAVAAWRAALARRWDYEVAARRAYKQIYRVLLEVFGSPDAPEIRLITRFPNNESTASDIIHDLQRMQAAIELHLPHTSIAPAQLEELQRLGTTLQQATDETERTEAQRRNSVFDWRLAIDAYQRARLTTVQILAEEYGVTLEEMLDEIIDR